MPTAVTRTRLIPWPAPGSGSPATRRSPTACSLAARTRSSSRRRHVICIPNGWLNRFRAEAAADTAKTSDPRAGRGSLARAGRAAGLPTPYAALSVLRGSVLCGGAAGQGHGRRVRLPGLVHPADRDLVARVVLDQDLADVGGRGDRLAGHRGDRVALGQAGAGRRGAGQGAGDGHAAAGAAAGAAAAAALAEPAEPAAVAEA